MQLESLIGPLFPLAMILEHKKILRKNKPDGISTKDSKGEFYKPYQRQFKRTVPILPCLLED